MKKSIRIIATVMLVAAIGAFVYFKGKRYEVIITQEQIDTTLAERFPVSKNHLLVFNITYTNPQITLLEDEDRIQINMDAELNFRATGEPKPLGGGVTVTTGIRYENKSQEFFLNDTEFIRLDIQGVPERWLEKVTEVASIAAKEYLETKPIYRIKAKDAKTAAAKMLLKDVEVRQQAIHISLGI